MKKCAECGKWLAPWEQFGGSFNEPICWGCLNESPKEKEIVQGKSLMDKLFGREERDG